MIALTSYRGRYIAAVEDAISSMFMYTVILCTFMMSSMAFAQQAPALTNTVSPVTLSVTSWIDCGPGNQNPQQAQYPLQCNTDQTFTRVQLSGNFSFDGGFFNETILDNAPWTCVGMPENPTVDTLTPSTLCAPLPNKTSISVRLLRPRIGWTLQYLFDVPMGYILLNYTANMTPADNFTSGTAYFLQNPDLLDNVTATGGANLTCGGLSNVQMNTQYGCRSMLSPYLTPQFMLSSGVCGSRPYTPWLERAVVQDPSFELLNAASCGTAAMCYPCNVSRASTFLNQQRVVYQTVAFGPACSVYEIQGDNPVLYVDAFINVTVGGVVRNGVYIPGMSDNQQMQTALSARSPTLRGSIQVQSQNLQVDVRQLSGYIVVCPDPSNNSTRAPGVMGNFNWMYNSSGYGPTPQINANTYPGPPWDDTVQSMTGGFFYLTRDQFQARFQTSPAQPYACGLSHVVQPDSATPTFLSMYRNAAAVNLSCAAYAYNASVPQPNTTTEFLGQMPLWSGACVPGQDPRFQAARNQTPCQIFSQMQEYFDFWLANPSLRDNNTQVPFLLPDWSMYHPQYFLAQLDQAQSVGSQNARSITLMYTPPDNGRGIVAEYNIGADISTDQVPYALGDSCFLVVNTAPGAGTYCAVDLNDQKGQYSLQVCQLGNSTYTEVTITVDQCPEDFRFMEQRDDAQASSAAFNGLEWYIDAPGNATKVVLNRLVLQRSGAQNGTAVCANTPPLWASLTAEGYDTLANVTRATLGTCRVTMDAVSRSSTNSSQTMSVQQSTTHLCLAVSPPRPLFVENIAGNQRLTVWMMLCMIVGGFAVVAFAISVVALSIYSAVTRDSKKDYAPITPMHDYSAGRDAIARLQASPALS